MKSNDFRRLCDNMCCKEVCILCFVKFVALVLFWYWKKKWYEYFPLTISDHLYFHRTSEVWSMLHHGSVGRIQSKQCNSLFAFPFFGIAFVVFHQEICAFIIFTSFFDEVSNFRYRILTNQKLELVIRNCQRNCTITKKIDQDASILSI